MSAPSNVEQAGPRYGVLTEDLALQMDDRPSPGQRR
jgi:hypothetical protein